ncbi:MAG: ATPase domain protein [Actinomycetia bacterium]|nr:ATPase domain protein [Actinomycetes bacterium]
MTPARSGVDLGPHTGRARAAVESAQLNACALDHGEVATGHLLLGLVTGPGQGIANVILSRLSVSQDVIKSEVEEGMGLGEQPAEEHLPFSEEARTALNLALRESPGTGPNRIGTDHLLIGLLREGGSAAGILNRHGIAIERVIAAREQLRSVMCYGCAEYGYEPEPFVGREWVLPPGFHAFDEQLTEIRRLKEEAIDAQDFGRAAEIRDAEKDLLRSTLTLLEENFDELDLPTAIDEIAQLRELVDHLRGLLHHRHGAAQREHDGEDYTNPA